MPRPINQAPYYDDYNQDKNYTTILAVPGYAEQAREFTQIQTTLYDYLGRLGDTLLSNGSIVDGCILVVQDGQAIVSSGRIYLDGLVRYVNGAVIDITEVGSEVIGAKLQTSVVTELEDPTLRDPAQGYENYNQPGAHRLKEEVVFTLNDEEAAAVFRLENGNLVRTEEVGELDKVVEILARRTFDESGNYKIDGLDLRDRAEVRDGKLVLALTEGKAYIKGFEVIKPTSFTVLIERSMSTRTIINEPKGFSTGTSRYYLNNQPVKEITQLKGIIQVQENVTRGNVAGGIDYLAKSPVVDIMSIVQSGTTYQKGVDFQLSSDGVDWSLPGIEPSIGSTYTIVYRYNKVMEQGTDYELELHEGRHCVNFLAGDLPVNGTTMDVTYDFYLARWDLVTLDRYGMPHVVEGRPDILRLATAPWNQDPDRLPIGTVLVHPNSETMEIFNINTVRLSMDDLSRLSRRVGDIEYNQAITDLDREAIDGERATDLKGIFTDGFIGITKLDIGHPETDCTIDIDNQQLGLPTVIQEATVAPDMDNIGTRAGVLGHVIMAPFNHLKALAQPNATGTMLVNPYAVYNPMRLVGLTPSVDNWVDTERMIVNQEQTRVNTINRWWWNPPRVETARASQVQRFSEMILDEAVMFMRQRQVRIDGSNLVPHEDNIFCEFNDNRVPLTPVSGTSPGTQAGTVKASSNGKISATFTVPPNTPVGSVNVALNSSTGQGRAVYRAQGRRQVIRDTVLTTNIVTNTVFHQEVRRTNVDPLAQSFVFDRDRILTKVGLYFAAKDPALNVSVEIRDMVNGYPGTTVFASAIVEASQVNVSAKGTAVTEVEFNQPVYCEADTQYCICILSDSNVYSMFTATLGQKDLLTDNFVTSQPYEVGVLFSSSNALTWTAHQTMDLKFDVYTANFTQNGEIIFEEVTGLSITRALLLAQVLDVRNSGVDWLYRADTGPWLPIDPYIERELGNMTSKIALKVVLRATQTVSPVMTLDAINLIGFAEKVTGTYVSRNVVMDETFTKIKVVADLSLPSGTSCRVFYQLIDDSEDWVELTDPAIIPLSTDFSRYEWNKDPVSAKQYRVKIVIDTVNPIIRPRVRKLMNILKY